MISRVVSWEARRSCRYCTCWSLVDGSPLICMWDSMLLSSMLPPQRWRKQLQKLKGKSSETEQKINTTNYVPAAYKQRRRLDSWHWIKFSLGETSSSFWRFPCLLWMRSTYTWLYTHKKWGWGNQSKTTVLLHSLCRPMTGQCWSLMWSGWPY